MIVIEGKAGKSVVLQDIINDQMRNRNVVVIDTVKVHGLQVPDGVDHLILDADFEKALEIFESAYKNEFSRYDWIVFEFNVEITEVDLSTFKAIDREYPQNFIVTVQNDALEQVNVYFA
ncbi:hypothetical protein LOZ80_39025 [Paenibacillus sp. HWE-109]|uniref:hypothetical protein n=1 Tax=Paenibacillus sp. HWE-109 TaxID=1306526 RepID=UPI001EDFAC1B|nr:hypothetical protein [Paenibacillus sp. HWE-109]UKS27360.1 hypothetical protein LOZ80_39025 [Paenibacillus sp. HWE-109]